MAAPWWVPLPVHYAVELHASPLSGLVVVRSRAKAAMARRGEWCHEPTMMLGGSTASAVHTISPKGSTHNRHRRVIRECLLLSFLGFGIWGFDLGNFDLTNARIWGKWVNFFRVTWNWFNSPPAILLAMALIGFHIDLMLDLTKQWELTLALTGPWMIASNLTRTDP